MEFISNGHTACYFNSNKYTVQLIWHIFNDVYNHFFLKDRYK